MKSLAEKIRGASAPLLNIYFTAGYPNRESLPEVLAALDTNEVDMVEIGFPYSDPLADGPTIQNSSQLALENGITIDDIFEQLASCEVSLSKLGMGYFNMVLQYGVERFCHRCAQVGIEALILPDLPIEIYLDQYKSIFESYGLSMIFMITPQTSAARIRLMDEQESPFLYAVSSASTTGQKRSLQDSADYLQGIKQMDLKTPILVGFNIRSAEDLEFVSRFSSGGIIGSAFIRCLDVQKNLQESISTFIKSLKVKVTVS